MVSWGERTGSFSVCLVRGPAALVCQNCVVKFQNCDVNAACQNCAEMSMVVKIVLWDPKTVIRWLPKLCYEIPKS